MAIEIDNSSSPQSSTGVEESIRGTPDTRITSMSQEGPKSQTRRTVRVLPMVATGDVSALSALDRQYNATLGHEKDPFLNSHHIQGTKLSPTASSFNPFMEAGSIRQIESVSPVATTLSNELGLSRYLLISSEEVLSVEKVQQWFNLDHSASNSAFPPFGQIQVTATAQKAIFDMCQLLDITRSFLQSYGRLFAFVKASCTPTGSLRAIAEFCDISHAFKLIKIFTPITTPEGVHLVIAPYICSNDSDNLPALITNNCDMDIPSHPYYGSRELSSDLRPSPMRDSFASPSFTMYPLMLQSPFFANVPQLLNSLTPRCNQGSLSPNNNVASSYSVLSPLYCAPPSPALTAQNNYSPSRSVPGFLRPDGRRHNATRVSKVASSGAANHHNYVDISRIRDGIDVRTTIMLRNIPNKVDQIMLKRIIDESSWGKYDFMYLRIDFANDCNVGYAFINFVDFVEVRGNQRCDKVAEISYASKDCLVQKFRNSSVMLEAPHYRPKLYFTSNGPRPDLAGQEEPFPEPDNQSKMKRSCENAEHVGQHYRDEQRRRRSQYDRGTRLAALEEYDYEAAIQNLYDNSQN
ncbi:hypothetical protein E4U43_002525 [Claviceps pusilla]|uniref:Mei2-like C-terminal RNA recognition motif domain-containing protein n=1 Tax=Claviceps pusilla TaxID=123648 RepID=A0A9P7NH31_9HYPO|nr:hypothetical protein E4U43_002525 [Claviceps pusilla]